MFRCTPACVCVQFEGCFAKWQNPMLVSPSPIRYLAKKNFMIPNMAIHPQQQQQQQGSTEGGKAMRWEICQEIQLTTINHFGKFASSGEIRYKNNNNSPRDHMSRVDAPEMGMASARMVVMVVASQLECTHALCVH